jgi:hypothetical protein
MVNTMLGLNTKNLLIGTIGVCFFIPWVTYAAISCSITTQAGCSGTTMLRMSGATNAHAELPSQSTSAYDSKVVCCTGPPGLSNSCGHTNKEVIVRMSGVTNAHVEKNTESGVSYTEDACLSSNSAGDEITIAYQANNCDGYDTTMFSMSAPTTNSQVGDTTAYSNKVCAKIFTQALTFSISDDSIGFGPLSDATLRYATGDEEGDASEVESFYIEVSTNASSGYSLYVSGDTLTKGTSTIDAIGGTNIIPTPGDNAFGIRGVATGGTGAVEDPYDGSGFAYDADDENTSLFASASSGDGATTTYSVRSVATIDYLLDYGEYTTNLTYIVVPNF